jgi:hypothetical protein
MRLPKMGNRSGMRIEHTPQDCFHWCPRWKKLELKQLGELEMVKSIPGTSFESTDAFLRIWSEQKLTVTLAKHILKLGFGHQDAERMAALAERNREGALSSVELKELDNFLHASLTLSVLQLRAKRFLQKSKTAIRRG